MALLKLPEHQSWCLLVSVRWYCLILDRRKDHLHCPPARCCPHYLTACCRTRSQKTGSRSRRQRDHQM